MACLKLHSLLQTVLCLSWEEVCFLLGRLGAPLKPSTSGSGPGNETLLDPLVPVVRALLDQHADRNMLQTMLPNLPPTNGSPSFAQDLQNYCSIAEWQHFYQNDVSTAVLTNAPLHTQLDGLLYQGLYDKLAAGFRFLSLTGLGLPFLDKTLSKQYLAPLSLTNTR